MFYGGYKTTSSGPIGTAKSSGPLQQIVPKAVGRIGAPRGGHVICTAENTVPGLPADYGPNTRGNDLLRAAQRVPGFVGCTAVLQDALTGRSSTEKPVRVLIIC